MPRVPSSTPQFSMQVQSPGGSSIAPGAQVNTAIAGFGEAVSRTAQMAANIYEKYKTVEAQTEADTAIANDRLEANRKLAELRNLSPNGRLYSDPTNPVDDGPNATLLRNPDGTPRTIADEFHSWANDRFSKNHGGMSSQLGANMYKHEAESYFTNLTGALQTESEQSYVKYGQWKRLDLAEKQAVDPVYLPKSSGGVVDATMYLQNWEKNHASIQGGVGVYSNQGEADQEQEKFNDRYGMVTVKTIMANIGPGRIKDQNAPAVIKGYLDMANGTDRQSVERAAKGQKIFKDTLSPEARNDFVRYLEGRMQTIHKESASDAMWAADQFIENQKMGDAGSVQMKPDEQRAALGAITSRLYGASVNDPEEARKYMTKLGEVMAANSIGQQNSLIYRQATPSMREQLDRTAVEETRNTMAAMLKRVAIPESYKPLVMAAALAQQEKHRVTINDDLKISTERDRFKSIMGFDNKYALSRPQDVSLLATVDWEDYRKIASPSVVGAMSSVAQQYFATIKRDGMNEGDVRPPIVFDVGKKIGDMYQNTNKSADEVAKHLQVMNMVYKVDPSKPSMLPQIINQMVADKSLTPEWRAVVPYVSGDATTLNKMINVIRAGKEDEIFSLAKTSLDKKEIDAEVYKYATQWAEASTARDSNSRKEHAAMMLGLMQKWAYSIAADGKITSKSAIAEKAYQDMIGNFYYTGKLDNGSSYIIPKEYKGYAVNEGTIVKNLQTYIDNPELLNPKIPKDEFSDKFIPMVKGKLEPVWDDRDGGGYYFKWYGKTQNQRLMMVDDKNAVFIPIETLRHGVLSHEQANPLDYLKESVAPVPTSVPKEVVAAKGEVVQPTPAYAPPQDYSKSPQPQKAPARLATRFEDASPSELSPVTSVPRRKN